jgi:hypothetical protein
MLERKVRNIISEEDAIQLAWQAIDYVHRVLPRGSVNKKSDEDKPDYFEISRILSNVRNNNADTLYRMKYVLSMNCKNIHPELQEMICKAALYEKCKAGNCEEQATVAYVYLKKLGVEDVDYVCMKDGLHDFLLLNGNIICDPWADKVYHVKDFEKVRAAAAIDIPYHYAVYEDFPDIRPYLFGMPYVKFRLDDKRPLSIVDGQFVRSGIDNFKIDYSEYNQALENARPSLRK